MLRAKTVSRNFLVLWRTREAESWQGENPGRSVGTHMKGLISGDTIFISSCDDQELYLLGALRISKTGKESAGRLESSYFAKGKSLAGSFQFLPLGSAKRKLRFEQGVSSRLVASKSLLWQVRARRRLSIESATLLLAILKQQQRSNLRIQQKFKAETRRLISTVSRIERDPRVRRFTLKTGKYTCSVCGLEPAEKFCAWARECLDVHHIRPLSENRRRGVTTMRDVILVCPTCHRALHLFPSGPAAWRRLRFLCATTA
jgi:hypothetical protein